MPELLQKNNPPHTVSDNDHLCFHCGESCEGEALEFDDKPFCCAGCKTVYELITLNDLDSFYQLSDQPGQSLRGKSNQDYAWLDDEDAVEKLVDFIDDTHIKISFHLPQIHCTSCVWLLENLYRLDSGVLKSQVNFLKQTAHITIDKNKLSLRELVEILARIGYAPRLHLDQLDKEGQKIPIDRTFAIQIGVAGFAFGNIMLMSFPEYFGLEELEFQQWFGYLNIILSLPVVFYSGRSYLQSAWQSLRQYKLNIDVPISLGIYTLLLRSVYDILTETGAGYLDSLVGLIFFLLIGKWFQQRTYHHLSFERDYKSYFPISVEVKTGEAFASATLDKLKIGDIVKIQNSGLLPADGLIVAGQGELDYSFVTGESKLIKKTQGEKVFAGGRQMGQNLEVLLTKNVSQSYLTQLWNNDAFVKDQNTSSSRLLERVGYFFTPAVLLIAFATLIYWWPKDITIALQAFTAVLIIACPCAIALSVPFTLGNAIRLLGKMGIFVKNTSVLEAIMDIDTLVFDKTGTLTTSSGSAGIYYDGKTVLSEGVKIIIRSLTIHSTHPISKELFGLWPSLLPHQVQNFKEFPGKGIQGIINEMPVQIGAAQFVQVKQENKKGTWIRIEDQIYGPFIAKNNFREGLVPMFQSLKDKFDYFLLSGDDDDARRSLSRFIPDQHLNFRQSPHDKLSFIKQKQEVGKHLMMIGDGLNDAGALQQSDVGMVVTEDVNNFTPACDIILASDQFSSLPQILGFIKNTIRLVYFALGLAFVYNVIGLSFAVQGLLSPLIAAILMPLSSISIAILGTLGSSFLFKRML